MLICKLIKKREFCGVCKTLIILADLLLMYRLLYTASQICVVGEFALQVSCLQFFRSCTVVFVHVAQKSLRSTPKYQTLRIHILKARHCDEPLVFLESHDRANGVEVVVALSVVVHIERTTRTGVEVPRGAVRVLRRRPNGLISNGYIS